MADNPATGMACKAPSGATASNGCRLGLLSLGHVTGLPR